MGRVGLSIAWTWFNHHAQIACVERGSSGRSADDWRFPQRSHDVHPVAGPELSSNSKRSPTGDAEGPEMPGNLSPVSLGVNGNLHKHDVLPGMRSGSSE